MTLPPLDDAAGGDGFFTIGIVGAKNSYNLGSLWRSAYQLGAAGLFVVNDRGAIGASMREASDTTKAWRKIPLARHPDWRSFCESQPFGAQWVAVEMGGEALEDFEHPERAVYVLGSEDSGLPESVLRACNHRVTLPCERYESFNVAVAGAMVLYDRLAKQRARG
jgi:tRNA G18 (ribose-2'-O)-methylase SpoU